MPTLRNTIERLHTNYPHAQPVDIYLRLYHQFVGPGTTPGTTSHETDRLRTDISDLVSYEPEAWEDTIEFLDDAETIGRLHLRPYLRAGGSLARLADTVAQGWDREADPQALAVALGQTRAILRVVWPDFDHGAFDKFLHETATEGFPVKEHSAAYLGIYDPRYRVIEVERLD